jgi:hypothetical protein
VVVIAVVVLVQKHAPVLMAVLVVEVLMAVQEVLETRLARHHLKVATEVLEAQAQVITVQVAAVEQGVLAQTVQAPLVVMVETEQHQASRVPL